MTPSGVIHGRREVHASRSARPWATDMVLRLDELGACDKNRIRWACVPARGEVPVPAYRQIDRTKTLAAIVERSVRAVC
jgi:hypothetical protein